jgi:predicted DNA-binding protein
MVDDLMAKKQGRSTRPVPKSDVNQYGIRMDDKLKTRINKYREQVQKSTGLEVGFSSVMRALIEKGLEAVAQ